MSGDKELIPHGKYPTGLTEGEICGSAMACSTLLVPRLTRLPVCLMIYSDGATVVCR